MENILRSFGAVIDDVDAKDRTIVAKISTGEVDRYRTVIQSRGVDFKNYLKNPIVLFEHGKSPVRGSVPIGRNVWIKQDGVGNGRILAKTRFAKDEFSDMLFSFYKDETMRGWSVSILPSEAGAPTREELRTRPELKDCELVYRSSELLEYSCVSVPGAADALSDPELRSLSTLVVRGFWTPPDEVKPLVDPIVERMCESGGMAEGGALVEDDAEPKKKKKRSADDGEDDEEEESGEEAERSMDDDSAGRLMDEFRDVAAEQLEALREFQPAAEEVPADPPTETVERSAEAVAESTPEPEPEPVVDPLAGLPPIVAQRLCDVVAEHARMVRDWREQNRAMIRELVDLIRGKA